MFQNLLSLYNPWWNNADWSKQGIQRELYNTLFSSIETSPYITILKGSRQTGKTFLIQQCIYSLLQKNISPRNIYYFLLDDLELAAYIENNTAEFANFLRNELKAKKKLYIFFDEFQKVSGITEIVKMFYEFESQIKFVLTGSSSLMIADKISESLLGRTETCLLYPFSFTEFLQISMNEWQFSFPLYESKQLAAQFINKPNNHFNEIVEHYKQFHFAYQMIASQYLPRYLLTGGYPQAALAAGSSQSFLRLKEIKQTFIEKDIVNLLRIEKLNEFDQCMRLLAIQNGNLLNFQDIQSTLNINFQKLKQFLNILEASYFWSTLRMFKTNKISSLKKRPKAYYYDTGIRNFLSSTFDMVQLEKEKGIIAENFCYMQLLKYNQYQLNGLGQLHFWRSPDGNEVDFIFQYKDLLLPIEVKYQRTNKIKIQRGFQIFLNKMNIEHAVLLSENSLEKRQMDQHAIYIVPLIIFGML